MRLFMVPFAPNVLRVQIVAAEKGVALELVNIAAGGVDFPTINPLRQVPALELDDGSILTESLIISQHLDQVSVGPSLFGGDAQERRQIAMWERRAEARLFNPGVEYGHHVHPMFAARMKQFPDFAATLVPKAEAALDVFADRLDAAPYLAGGSFTVVDITGFLGYAWFVAFGAFPPSTRTSLRDWSGRVTARESMAIFRDMAAFFHVPRLD